MEQHQSVEGIRRRLTQAEVVSAVNDAAPWIDRMTSTNCPAAELIMDWHHAQARLRTVGEAVFGHQQAVKHESVETCLDNLWHGETSGVIAA